MPASVLADDTRYDNTRAPHESPHKAGPPTGGHENLADAATNPIGNLIQFQLQNQYNWVDDNVTFPLGLRLGKVTKIGKQKIVDEGPLPPHPTKGIKYNMETVDDHILELTENFMEKAKKDGKPFFVWYNPTRMHVYTHLSPHYKSLMTPENSWSPQESGMKQFDDLIGSVMKKLDELGEADNTIIIVSTDNGTETFTWPDGGNTPFRGEKGMGTEGGFRVPAIAVTQSQGVRGAPEGRLAEYRFTYVRLSNSAESTPASPTPFDAPASPR